MGTVGGMKGKANHMHNEAAHFSREGHKKGSFGVSQHHVHAGTHVANNHSGHHDHKKAAGTGQKSGHGSESKAHAIEGMHAGKMPNNR